MKISAINLQRKIYSFVIVGCGAFIVLTLLAMLLYPGGTSANHATHGYRFFYNFLSDLGLTVAYNGQPNWASALLFFVALGLAGSGLVLFFLAFRHFFRAGLLQRLLSLIGSVVGVVSGICFVGVAFTPANLLRQEHIRFVMWAFELFPIATFFYIPAMFLNHRYLRRYAWAFVVFWLLLVGYYLLMQYGPPASTSQGLLIQATGQKMIAYASIISILFQSLGAKRQLLVE
jgi:hypothetical protein